MKYIRAKHDRDLLTVEFVAEDGTRYLRSGGTICWRFFNPGNIRTSKTSVCNALKIGMGDTKSGRFMIFPDYDTGWKALKMLLKVTYKDCTIKTVARTYAPPNDGNDPDKYTDFIVRRAGVDAEDYIRDMDDVTLERVMEAIKQMEGYYNKKETQQENIVQTTNVIISDGNKPLANEKVKVVIDQCTYEWSTNQYGELPPIAHLPGRNKIEIIGAGPEGTEDVVYSAAAGIASQNVLLLKNFQVFSAKTKAHKEGDKPTTVYIIKKGDTLGKIARNLQTTVKRLADLNSIKDVNVVSVGQELKIPDGSSKPLKAQPAQMGAQEVPTGSSDKGYPQANIGDSTDQAPWMEIAIREAKQWSGAGEGDITDNYHVLSNIGKSHTLSNTPWCASFVTYCLQCANFSHSRAYASSSQFPVYEANKFIEIKEPIYGAIMVFKNYYDSNDKDTGTGHIAFVYGKTQSGTIAALGGDQGGARFGGGTIKLSEYSLTKINARFERKHQLFYKFYIPVGYVNYKNGLNIIDVDTENADVFGIGIHSKKDEGGSR